MNTTMVRSVMLSVLMHFLLASHGALRAEPQEGAGLHAAALDLPWQDELCCDSPSTHRRDGTRPLQTNRSATDLPRCNFRSSAARLSPHEASGGVCVSLLCGIDENWENLSCRLQPHGTSPGVMAVSFQRLASQRNDTTVNDGQAESYNPVVCEGEDSFMCSVALDATTNFVTTATIIISDVAAPPILLSVPARPLKRSPPTNLSHVQTIKPELILQWDAPEDSDSGSLRYEVRYSSNSTHPTWRVVSAPVEPRLILDLRPRLNYTIQVRCSSLAEPPLWSDWSEPHHIYLHTVSYSPKKVVARPGENVTVYCVFNDHTINASTAMWVLNFVQPLHHSLYHPVNQWVSQITVRPSDARFYELLQCTQKWSMPYSQIFVEGASIDINCETNGDVDAMICSWKKTQLIEPEFQSRWAYQTCDEMEKREKAGKEVGVMGPACLSVRPGQTSCAIRPVRMSCYKLWLEMPSLLGPIRSKPVYLSPMDYVKPHTPTNLKAVSQSSGVLKVTWEPPSLPAQGLQSQLRLHSPSSVRAQPAWKVYNPVQVPWAEVPVPNMCRVYVVQVRCMRTNSTGYWSDWSDSVYSTPQNSQAPERGPDFWRVLQDDPYRNQTNVTLLFEPLPISGQSYCVDGFIVERQASNGVVMKRQIELGSSYSFEWNQDVQTVTVKAYNSLGSSVDNVNMTLEKKPKRRCVQTFQVLIINSTCVSLFWSLLDNSSVPVFMVVQWWLQRQRGPDPPTGQGGDTWARVPYTPHAVYLRGDFFGSEEYGFYLYPVFADGEGEPAFTMATRGDPAAYMMLMIISFLAIVLFVTMVISQNQMKKFLWKDVPNPNHCSWAKGLDLTKADALRHLFQPPDGLPAWPLLLPSENISKVAVMDTTELSAFTTATPDPASALAISRCSGLDSETILGGVPSLTTFDLSTDELQLVDLPPDQPATNDSSAQSSVAYATVLLAEPQEDQQPIHPQYKDGSGSSSSDEGNFSANNSDISGSFPGGLWELGSCRGGEMDDPRHSCSYNSVEELSETSEQEDEDEATGGKDVYYLDMDYPAEEEREAERIKEETKSTLYVVLDRGDCSVESHPLLGPVDPHEPRDLLSESLCGFSPLYLPQFRTPPCTRQLTD